MKKVFILSLILAFALSLTVVAFADNSVYFEPTKSFTAPGDIVISSRLQREYVKDVFDLPVYDESVISLTDVHSNKINRDTFAANHASKAIKCVTELPGGVIEVNIAVPLIKDNNGHLINAFSINPNYLNNSVYATSRSRQWDTSIPDITYRVIGYYTQEVISNHYVYRLLSAKFKWWRADSSSSYKVNRFILNAAVCGDLYDTSFNLIQTDYEKMKTLDKSSPTIDTYYSTGTIMSSTGNVVTVGGGDQGATLDWEYWVYNRDGSNVRDIGSATVFAP
ncbi:MAG: hypothetical protein ACI4L8_06540 [Candidatus Fimadaptatus sp.]